MLKICYTGRITHILRSCAPSIALDFCRSFNSLRTEFFADLLDVEPGMLKSHLFSSANLGGIGFTKSSILCQSAFLGGGKNFIYEFSRRFSDDSHLLVPNCSPYLYELSCELEKLPPQIWTKCFPQSIQEIPNRSLFNLQFCCKFFFLPPLVKPLIFHFLCWRQKTHSDSDTDWNAQVKVLPVRSSSSPSLLHSPHPPSYARNSSQKISNSKNDQRAAKNTKLSKNVPRCSSFFLNLILF
ncbi:hypothetical protein P9112_009415 [Eukaryota sp. TZLM1-RC]